MKISIDTRTIQPGDFFIPMKGIHHDGHDFIPEALRKGGRILDVEITAYAKKYRKKLECPVIGVTGSAGKTTVKDLVASVLGQGLRVIKTAENQNNEIGVPLTVLSAEFDTQALVVEMGMRHKGEISHLTSIVRPTHVIITSIGKTHIELLKSEKNIAFAKAEIFKAVLSWEKRPRYAFLNYSSLYYDFLKQRAQRAGYQVLPFGGQDKPEQNVNLCYTLGHHFGLSDAQISDGIASYQGSKHRLHVSSFRDITVIDDSYNANPDGVLYALQFLRRFKGRKIFVLGDMLELGDFSASEHQKVVEYAMDAGVDILFTLGKYTHEIRSTGLLIYSFLDRDSLHALLLPELKSGDVVLVKGSRGMAMEETVSFIKERHV